MSKIAKSRLSVISSHVNQNRCSSTSVPSIKNISRIESGIKFTNSYKQYAASSNGIISYFHDVPLDFDSAKGEANMVVEIPRWSNAKFEISTNDLGNPIKQDTKKGKVRFVKNLFPYHGYIHNYGAFSQTWEDPTVKNEELNLFGDGDPLDVCEIGSKILNTGDVKRVKILGSLALIDDGELDWKIIVIDIEDSLSQELNDIQDVEKICPGLLDGTRQWFRDYKKPDGKPENEFAFNGNYIQREDTLRVIEECRDSWERLVAGEIKGKSLPSIQNTTLPSSKGFCSSITDDKSSSNKIYSEQEVPVEIQKSYFV